MVAVCRAFFDNCQHGDSQSFDNNNVYSNRHNDRLYSDGHRHNYRQSDTGCDSQFRIFLRRRLSFAFRNRRCILQLVTIRRAFIFERIACHCFAFFHDDLHCNRYNFRLLIYSDFDCNRECQSNGNRQLTDHL